MMTQTEEEARELWCPQTRAADCPSDASNRVRVGYTNTSYTPADNPYWSRCIASRCMAWRWAQKPNPDWLPHHGQMQSYPPRDMRNDAPMYIDDTTRGYCGLAGKP